MAFRMGPPGAADLLTITRENGRITEISPARYAMMINDLVMGTNNYYVYFWY